MGMFDSVKIDIKCPFCGNTSKIDAQTKELECDLDVFEKGDFVTDRLNYLECLADCRSEKCLEFSNKDIGYKSGFGRMFNVKILLDKGIVSGVYEILKD